MFINKAIATFFGIGYIGKGAGTVASFAFCLLLYVAIRLNLYSESALIIFTVITFISGVFVSTKLEVIWGKDSNRIVIDEVLGMSVSILFLPINFITLGLGFILFRFFDIFKPLFIKKAEKLKGGMGVMTDDLVAGIYANIVLQIFVYFFLWDHANIF
ncbi:phosphatidylglycerophosphatase A family protein [Aurantibacillus circumpalustris]|uniref:phosphatidylglycerophosphatase A family protein n=1 Tax=Aurantibacillus circumpalustris TaxID=3036359 RepID=UPI00295BFBF1|nr:phosphatidylglycerophosphatase A [Aurantibacillus circumpalustris]